MGAGSASSATGASSRSRPAERMPKGSRPKSPAGVPALPFAAVNRPGQAGHANDLQRHHLLPRQALHWPAFQPMWQALGTTTIGFDNFRRNGILLPARETAVLRLGLPLHLGPHRDYNAMVIERLGTIESAWSRQRLRGGENARALALIRIALLQGRCGGAFSTRAGRCASTAAIRWAAAGTSPCSTGSPKSCGPPRRFRPERFRLPRSRRRNQPWRVRYRPACAPSCEHRGEGGRARS